MVKRGVDVVVSVILLLVTAPIVLLSACVIWLSSPGPVLFRQQRMGRGFQPFWIIKLRTMKHGEPGPAYTLGADPRITLFGKWLRRTKTDELPQLWNVLRGEMSLVGPRPVRPELALEFRHQYRALLRERPGLTDPASLKYSQEARLLKLADDPMGFFKRVVTPDKIAISMDYMENANVWTDAVTLFMTALICVVPAFGNFYGRLPVPRGLAMSSESHRRQSVRRTAVGPDGVAFSYSLAEMEAAEEFRRMHRQLPWNLLQIGELTHQSTLETAGESASRL